MARKRRMPPRNKKGRFMKRGAAKTARKRRAAPKRRRAAPKRRRRAAPKRRRVARRRTRRVSVTVKTNPRRRRRRARRNPRRSRARVVGTARIGRRQYKVRGRMYKRASGKRYGKAWITKNPMSDMKSALKSGLLFYAGLLGMRVVNKLIYNYGVKRLAEPTDVTKTPTGSTLKLYSILPAAGGFVISTMLLPHLLKGKGDLVKAFQMGSVVALAEAVMNTFIKPELPANVQAYLGDLGAEYHVPMAAYVPYDNRLSEYVDEDNRYGYGMEAHEPLSASEVAYLDHGGAGGIFSKTSLGIGR